MSQVPENLIRRADGSYVDIKDVEPRKALAHEMVVKHFPEAERRSTDLAAFKRLMLSEMNAYADMMMADYGVKVRGKENGFSLQSLCGTMRITLDVSRHVTLGPELNAAKALIDEFLETKLEGSADEIRQIVTKVFKINKKGRVDTYGILGLREFKFEDELWSRAMGAIEDAICRDSSTTYLRFYQIDPSRKSSEIVPMDWSKV